MAECLSLLQNLADHIQERKAVTYKWFAREYSLPANYAKQLLFRFAEEQGSKIRAVYMVSGSLKATDGLEQHVVRLVPAAELDACCGQLQEGTVSVHIHSVLPSLDGCSLEPTVLYAEDAEQTRHFYQAMTQDATVGDGCVDVYARNVCSSISFSPSIMTRDERRQRIQDKLRQQKEDQAAAAADKGGAKGRKQPQQQTKQPPKLNPAATSTPAGQPGTSLASPAPAAQPALSPLPAGKNAGTGPAGNTSPFVRSPAPSPAATTPAAPAPAVAAPAAAAAAAAATKSAKGGGPAAGAASKKPGKSNTGGKGSKQGGLANLWGKAAKPAPKPSTQAAAAAPPPAKAVAPPGGAADAAPAVQGAAKVEAVEDDVVVGSKRRRGRQLLVEDEDEDEGDAVQQQQQPGGAAKQARGRVLMDIDSDEEEDDKPAQQQQQLTAAPSGGSPAAPAANQTTGADQDADKEGPSLQHKQQQPQKQPQKQLQTQGDCDTRKDQAATPGTAAVGNIKQQQQLKGCEAARNEPADVAVMASPLARKATARGGADGAATPAVELQTPAAATTPKQPPAKRQKGYSTGFGFSSAQTGQPRIDPVTGEEIWGEEEEKPTPKPGFISTPAVMGGSKAAPTLGSKVVGKGSSKAAGQGGSEAGASKAAAGGSGGGAKKKAAATGGGKKGATTVKAAQKNIMSFFGRS